MNKDVDFKHIYYLRSPLLFFKHNGMDLTKVYYFHIGYTQIEQKKWKTSWKNFIDENKLSNKLIIDSLK